MILRRVRTEEGGTSTSTALPTPIPSPSILDIAGGDAALAEIFANTITPPGKPIPSLMFSPSPTPTPTPAPLTWPTACSNYYTIGIPEDVALAVRNGDNIPMDELKNQLLITLGLNTSINLFPFFFDIALSPVPISGEWAVMFGPPDPTITTCVTATYGGYQTPTTSVPGTTITDTIPAIPAPQMPNEVRPLINSITNTITQQIAAPILESGSDLLTVTNAIADSYNADLEDIYTTTTNLTGDIIRPQVTAINQLYDDTYPVGISPPTVDQIISGEIPYNPNLPPGASTCPAPIINVAPAAVSCPAPAAITFSPQITVNVPQQDRPTVSVSTAPITIDIPAPVPVPVAEVPEVPEIEVVIEPTPTPTPSPTPMEEPVEEVVEPTPTPAPTPYLGGNFTIPTTPTKPPPPPTPKPYKVGKFNIGNGSDWSNTTACTSLTERSVDIGDTWFHQLLGITTYANAGSFITGIASIPVLGSAFAQGIWGFTDYIVSVIEAVPKSFIEGTFGKSAGPFIGLTLAGFGSKFGMPLDILAKGLLYDYQYIHANGIPSESDFVNLFLADFIDEKALECMVKANGSYYSWYQKLAGSNRQRVAIDQIIALHRRGIYTEAEANKELRGNGVLTDFDKSSFYRSTEAMPTVSDIVRFMVRDADDNDIASKYRTDEGLKEKYGPQLQSWAKGQGITDEVMKYYWRSHWEIPSNTQLFEMLHRLRPDRPDAAAEGNIVIDADDIKNALIVNDTLPVWADALMAISYKPLTRTDAQRAFMIDAVSKEELYASYRDLGYSDANAERLVRFTMQLKAKRKQASGGTEKVTAVLKYYKGYLIGRTEALQRLKNGGLSDTGADDALFIADRQRKNDSQMACIKGLKKKYMIYAVDPNEVIAELRSIGVAIENVTPLLATWNCERGSKLKELSLAQIASAYKNNVISPEEYMQRIERLGYQDADGVIIFESVRGAKDNRNRTDAITELPGDKKTPTEKIAAAGAIMNAALEGLGLRKPPQ
jgi:hypothetical protein